MSNWNLPFTKCIAAKVNTFHSEFDSLRGKLTPNLNLIRKHGDGGPKQSRATIIGHCHSLSVYTVAAKGRAAV